MADDEAEEEESERRTGLCILIHWQNRFCHRKCFADELKCGTVASDGRTHGRSEFIYKIGVTYYRHLHSRVGGHQSIVGLWWFQRNHNCMIFCKELSTHRHSSLFWRTEEHWKSGCMVSCRTVQSRKRCEKIQAKPAPDRAKQGACMR